MSETINKNDFIEIEFTGRSSTDNQIFDTTNPKEAEEIGIQEPSNVKPLIISVGNDMMLKGLDETLEGKELDKEYSIHLEPNKAFGKRNPQLIRVYNITAFTKNNINPYPGLTLQLDNSIAKVLSVSGGRVTVDFNNPLAGKDVDYTFKITKRITDNNEKVNALQDFFFKQRFEFSIKENKVIFKDEKLKPLTEMLNQKFKDIIKLDFEVEEAKPKKEETPEKEDKKEETPKKEEPKEKEIKENPPKEE